MDISEILMSKELIEQLKFDEERGFLPRGYTDKMMAKFKKGNPYG